MPKMGYDMTEGTLAKWLKKAGDEVSRGEPIAEIETDKVTIEVESFDSGTITELLVNEGDTVPVGAAIARLDDGSDDEDEGGEAPAEESAPAPSQAPTGEGNEAAPSAPAPAQTPDTVQPAQREDERASAAPTSGSPAPAGGARVLATPAARSVAKERGVDLATLQGSGPGGRIVRADVAGAQPGAAQPAAPPTTPPPAQREYERAPAAAPAAAPAPAAAAASAPTFAPPAQGAEYSEQPLSRLRQTAARRMVESQQQVPPFFVTSSIEMDAAQALLPKLQEAHGGRLSVTELLLKGCAIALKKFPALNSTFAGDKLLQHNNVHISVAVATDAGLLAPVVRNCDTLGLGSLSNNMREIIKRTRDGKATMEDLTGGTFTISNLGMFDVTNFIAIITPPQAAILAVGSTIPTPVVRDGEIVVRQLMNVTISVDHRVSDGATAAQFLQELKALLQNPLKLLL